MIEGWKCPECNQVFAPFIKKCDRCGDQIKITINPITEIPHCAHIWGEPRTNGVFCLRCGQQKIIPPLPTTTCGGTNGND